MINYEAIRIWVGESGPLSCPCCGAPPYDPAKPLNERGVPYFSAPVHIDKAIHGIYCGNCGLTMRHCGTNCDRSGDECITVSIYKWNQRRAANVL